MALADIWLAQGRLGEAGRTHEQASIAGGGAGRAKPAGKLSTCTWA